eukprot:1158103-Pelagomonas_calceolata.AAC.6
MKLAFSSFLAVRSEGARASKIRKAEEAIFHKDRSQAGNVIYLVMTVDECLKVKHKHCSEWEGKMHGQAHAVIRIHTRTGTPISAKKRGRLCSRIVRPCFLSKRSRTRTRTISRRWDSTVAANCAQIDTERHGL